MSDECTDKTQHTHIRDEDVQRQYVLHPRDNDLFVRTGRQIIEGCRLGISVEVWMDECRGMFDFVQKWAHQRAAVSECYAVPRGAGIALFIVPVGDAFDFDLADEAAGLTAELTRGFNTGPVEVYQTPAGELTRFVPDKQGTRVYSDADPTPQTMET